MRDRFWMGCRSRTLNIGLKRAGYSRKTDIVITVPVSDFLFEILQNMLISSSQV